MYRQIEEKINKNKEKIVGFGRDICHIPELGFKEYKTREKFVRELEAMKMPYLKCTHIPGFKATLDTGKPGPSLGILAELDALVCPGHPCSNSETKAAHACGHDIQMAAMFGAIIVMADADMLNGLCGKINFIGVPAEEFIELEYRQDLMKKGIIAYPGGKPELLKAGVFDDIDLCMSIHAFPAAGKIIGTDTSTNGFLYKYIQYRGKSAHPFVSPEKGVNAFSAANIGITALNSIRDTFSSNDTSGFYAVLSDLDGSLNTIPDQAVVKINVKGRNIKALEDAAGKVERALLSGAIATGADMRVETIPGYMPFKCEKGLLEIALKIVCDIGGEKGVMEIKPSSASTDLGDISTLMPVVQAYTGGVSGTLHGADFKICDEETAYLTGVRFFTYMINRLLCSDAAAAKKVLKEFKPHFNHKKEYFEFVNNLYREKDYVFSDICQKLFGNEGNKR